MSNSVHLTMPGVAADASLNLDVTTPTGDLYVAFEILVPTASFTNMPHGTFGPDFLYVENAAGSHFVQDIGPADYSGGAWTSWFDDWYTDVWSIDFPASGLADTWIFVETWLPATSLGVGYYKINGQAQQSIITGSMQVPGKCHFGIVFPQAGMAASDVWVNRVQIGSVDKGSDLFTFDPATDNYATAFTSTTGTVAAAAPPVSQPAQFGIAATTGQIEVSGSHSSAFGLASGAVVGNALASGPTQLYLEAAIYIVAGTMAGWAPTVEEPNIFTMSKGSDRFGATQQTLFPDPVALQWVLQSGGGGFAAITEGTWQVIKLFQASSGAGYADVDGTRQNFSQVAAAIKSWWIGVGENDGKGGDIWLGYLLVGSDDGLSDILRYVPGSVTDVYQDTTFITGTTARGAAPTTPPDPPTPPTPDSTVYQSPYWRFVVGDLQTFEVLSFLDKLASERTATYTLNQPAIATGKVPSDNPEINIPWPAADSDPFLAEGSRVLWGFRREGLAEPFWTIRYAGMILQLEDDAQSDNAYTTYTAWDPWQYLFSRPVCNLDGSLPGPNGISFTATRVDVIAAELLRNTIVNHGICGIDAGDGSTGAPPAYQDWGGTSYYTGTINAATSIDINFAQGTSVGDAWKQLCDAAYCDIILEPIYDPINRSGYLVQFNIYNEAGSERDDAIFAWDMPSRSLVGVHRLIEGSKRANEVKFFAGQGGSAAGGQTVPVQTDAASVTKYGEYWMQVFLPGQAVAAAVEALAAAQLALAKNGRTTVTFSPAPQRSPIPFLDYTLGDSVPVYASNRFRAPLANSDTVYQRIYGIPLQIGDDATEQVQQMLTSPPNA